MLKGPTNQVFRIEGNYGYLVRRKDDSVLDAGTLELPLLEGLSKYPGWSLELGCPGLVLRHDLPPL